MPRDDLQTPQPPFSATTTLPPGPPTSHHSYCLPNNPMPYLAPSVTHQPELLLLHWMINTISSLVEDLQHHPIVQDPIPPMSTFTNTPAYRVFLQTCNTLRHLINTTHDARRGLNKLQFLPGSPGSPGHYRIDPTLDIPPQQTNLLSAATSQRHPTTPSPANTPPLIRRLNGRDRSRSRDRLPLTTLSQPNHTTTRPSQTDLLQIPATADTYIKHFGRPPTPAPPPRELAACLLTHRPPPLEAPRQRLVSHITLCSERKNPSFFRFLHTISILPPSSHTFISAAI